MNHEPDEQMALRRARLSPEGREVLDELERSSEAFEPLSEEVRGPALSHFPLRTEGGRRHLRGAGPRVRGASAGEPAECPPRSECRGGHTGGPGAPEGREEAAGSEHDPRGRPGDTRAVADLSITFHPAGGLRGSGPSRPRDDVLATRPRG